LFGWNSDHGKYVGKLSTLYFRAAAAKFCLYLGNMKFNIQYEE
jgi:hypothetical protein